MVLSVNQAKDDPKNMYFRRSIPLLITLLLVASAFLNIPRQFSSADTKQDGPFTNNTIRGSYLANDLFALLDGNGNAQSGSRDFDGLESTDGSANLISSISFPSRPFQKYEVLPNGSFRTFLDPNYGPGFVGTVGKNGSILVYAPFQEPGQDNLVDEGYAAFHISAAVGPGQRNSDVNGSYSYHALVFDDQNWWNIFGNAVPFDLNQIALGRDGADGLFFPYSVVDANGRMRIGDLNPQNPDNASLALDGDLLFESVKYNANRDPLFPSGYEGLAVYVRRRPNTSTDTPDLLNGAYRVHELHIQSNGTITAPIGQVQVGPNNFFAGTLEGEPFEDQLEIFPSGTFLLQERPDLIGTLGADGDFVVITPAATVDDFGDAWMQLWVRTAGGAPSENDRDGDGLADDAEQPLGTDPDDSDSDQDFLLDSVDPDPTEPDNVFTATLESETITVTEVGPGPDPIELSLDANGYPFFDWSITSSVEWLEIDTPTGRGDTTVELNIDNTALDSTESPIAVILTIDALNMLQHDPITLTVNVALDSVPLELSVSQLDFFALEGGSNPLPQTVKISSPLTTNFEWIATPNTNWLIPTPAFGSGPATITIDLDISILSSLNAPFSGTVLFSRDINPADFVDLSVNLDLQPPRSIGEAFPVAPSPNTQLNPAVDYNSNADLYLIAWEEGLQVHASILDGTASPRLIRAQLSLQPQGIAAQPTAVIDSDTNTGWVIWQQRTDGNSIGFIQGRTINLSNATAAISSFGIAGGASNLQQPAALYNPDQDEIVVVYLDEANAGASIKLVRIDPDDRTTIATVNVSPTALSLDQPRIALDPQRNQYLITWSETFTNQDAPPEIEERIWARLIDASNNEPVTDSVRLNNTPSIQEQAVPHYNTQADDWNILYREKPVGSTANFTLLLARVPTDTAAARGPSATSLMTISGSTIEATGHTLAYGAAPEQLMLLWSEDQVATDRFATRRTTPNLLLLGDVAPIPNGGGTQTNPQLIYNSAKVEFLPVWQRKPANDPAQIYAMRITGGTPDEDNDGLPDEWELTFGLDPFDATGDNGANGDPDRDLLENLEEFTIGTDPTNPDTDDDGLLDRQEDRNHDGILDPDETNPNDADTDNDGANDDAEWFLGTNGNDPAETPTTGLYRIEFAPFSEDQITPLTLHAFIDQEDVYTFALNPTETNDFLPPDGWTATPISESRTTTLTQGTHTFTFHISPLAPVTPTTAHALFDFHLIGAAQLDSAITANLIVDTRQTGTTATPNHNTLAQQYAPVLRLHRNETFRPIPIEFTLGNATLDRVSPSSLPRTPDIFDLYQTPQTTATLNFLGTTLEELEELLPEPDEQPQPTAYYTVTTLGKISAEPNPPENHTVIQYYLHFLADDWADAPIAGGHRHEGDWEMLQIFFDENLQPYQVTATQQRQLALDGEAAGGQTRLWGNIETVDASHPVLYPGEGHSLYFTPGATRYTTGLESHDGLGQWILPAQDNIPLVTTEYNDQSPMQLLPIPRLGEILQPKDFVVFGWLPYAGRWGQENFPADDNDIPTPSTQAGPRGPVFLGNTRNPTDPAAVQSFWLDPFAWAQRAPTNTPVTNATIRGDLPAGLDNETVVLTDARGRIYRDTSTAFTGAFSISAPPQNYVLTVVATGELGIETYLANALFQGNPRPTLLFPTRPAATVLGTLTLEGTTLTAPDDPYANNDADGDTITDDLDQDQDNDGSANSTDIDPLGDGWIDAFQIQDPDDDGIISYYDDDDDGDGIPDTEDEDANGNNIDDLLEPSDFDGDGFIDDIDLDQDNDGFYNQTERDAGTSPTNFFDTPDQPAGDLDDDRELDATDIQILINIALNRAPYDPRADFDQNQRVEAADLQQLINRILAINL